MRVTGQGESRGMERTQNKAPDSQDTLDWDTLDTTFFLALHDVYWGLLVCDLIGPPLMLRSHQHGGLFTV